MITLKKCTIWEIYLFWSHHHSLFLISVRLFDWVLSANGDKYPVGTEFKNLSSLILYLGQRNAPKVNDPISPDLYEPKFQTLTGLICIHYFYFGNMGLFTTLKKWLLLWDVSFLSTCSSKLKFTSQSLIFLPRSKPAKVCLASEKLHEFAD